MGRRKATDGDTGPLLIEGAARGFRAGGLNGIGVDGLARQAGLTSGAFYARFGSKAAAFRATVETGVAYLAAAVTAAQEDGGDDWRGRFVDFYLIELLSADIESACAVPTFAVDVMRSDDATRATFDRGLGQVVDRLALGIGGDNARARAWALLSLLVGAAAVARALPEGSEGRTGILDAARTAALAV